MKQTRFSLCLVNSVYRTMLWTLSGRLEQAAFCVCSFRRWSSAVQLASVQLVPLAELTWIDFSEESSQNVLLQMSKFKTELVNHCLLKRNGFLLTIKIISMKWFFPLEWFTYLNRPLSFKWLQAVYTSKLLKSVSSWSSSHQKKSQLKKVRKSNLFILKHTLCNTQNRTIRFIQKSFQIAIVSYSNRFT